MSKRWEVFIWFVIVLGLSLCFYGIHAANSQELSVKQVDELKAAPVGAEIKSLRTKNAETFKADDKGKLQTKIYTHDKFYYDSAAKEYKERTFTYDGKAFGSRGYTVEYKPLFEENTANLTTAKEQTATGVKETIVLKNVDAPTLLSWTIVTNATYTLDAGAVTFWTGDDVLFVTQTPTAWDVDGKTVKVTVSIDKGVLLYDVDVKGAAFPVTVDPSTVIYRTPRGIGHASRNSSSATWIDMRNLTTAGGGGADTTYAAVQVGRFNNATSFSIQRGFYATPIDIPAGAIIDSIKLALYSGQNLAGDSLAISIVASYQTIPVTVDSYNDFYGWASSGAYSVIKYANDTAGTTINESGYTQIKFNAVGVDSAEANIGGTLKMALLNPTWDIAGSTPVQVNSNFIWNIWRTFIEGETPYVTIWYRAPYTPVPTGFTLHSPSFETMLYYNGNNVPLYKK